MKNYDENICRHAMNRIFGFHPVTGHALVERFGSAAALFSTGGLKILDEIGAGYKDVARICDREYGEAEKEWRQIHDSGARFLWEDDPYYPSLLKECRDRPLGLYIRSESPDEEIFGGGRRFVAVVGTRDISPYGSEWCTRIVGCIAGSEERPAIVSGLALGTDITAHKKALDSGLRTIAVLPTGIDAVYPHQHTHHARRIASSPGCALITDFPPGTRPAQYNFLRRNRIIAGMSEAVILVESKIKGGGMMTARLASSYSRDVYALPGRVEDLRSQGCNALIMDRTAEAIASEESLLKSLGLKGVKMREKSFGNEAVARRFSGRMDNGWIEKLAAVLLAVKQAGGSDIEQISRTCGFEYRETAELVSVLESDGMINVDIMQRCTINYG